MVEYELVICKALGSSTPSTKIKSRSFVLFSKKNFYFSQLRLVVPSSGVSVTLFFLSDCLSILFLTAVY